MYSAGRWGNNGFGGAKRWEGKSNNGGFAGKMKGGDMANRNKQSRFSPIGKPSQPQVGNIYGYSQRMGGENKFNVSPPPPPPPSGDMKWAKSFSQPPKTNGSASTGTAPKASKPVLSVKEMCTVQGMAAPGTSNAYNYQAFLNAFGCPQMQTVQQ